MSGLERRPSARDVDGAHDHSFGQGRVTRGERRTRWVVALTAVFMLVEITAGVVFGSMALLADGLHMASHAIALGISIAAYVYARRRASDARFSFGTGKVNSLGGFTGAVLLSVFALTMAVESGARFLRPVPIEFDKAIGVAVLGLFVNGVSVALLGTHGHEQHDGDHDHEHDHNLRSAYLHVLADSLTSIAAIAALIGGRFLGAAWLDPAMGVVGSLLVARWSWGLLRESSRVLLDHQASPEVLAQVRTALEAEGRDRVIDLHVWSIGPGIRAACIAIRSSAPRSVNEYKALLPDELDIRHVTLELHAD